MLFFFSAFLAANICAVIVQILLTIIWVYKALTDLFYFKPMIMDVVMSFWRWCADRWGQSGKGFGPATTLMGRVFNLAQCGDTQQRTRSKASSQHTILGGIGDVLARDCSVSLQCLFAGAIAEYQGFDRDNAE